MEALQKPEFFALAKALFIGFPKKQGRGSQPRKKYTAVQV
jgi:hypothetical protein